ncbi:MAG TPA: carboxypeptidase-like regulatory domain-containing protein, partial [Blastocatellia bacterium]|nr:carboxypeptidase-like regulatory domain-containing protein [Blastocatellia bacterium]
ALSTATITVTEAATNQSVTAHANERGDFVAPSLNPGLYRVTVSSAGFQTTVINSVEVQVGQSSRVDVEMKVGEVSSTIEVTSSAPLLDTESGTLGHVVTNTQIVNLPLNGRSYYELARLTPGAALLPGGGNLLRIRANFSSGTAISGVRGRQTTFLMDGVDITDHHQGGTLIHTSIDALQEFKVQQSAYSSEFSHAGGLLNGTTKSGTNAFHGGLFEFLRNDKLDARNFFAREREVLKRNQFGGTLGGPVSIPKLYNGRDRTFFFASYEGMRERQGLVFNSIVPTAAMKRGDFSAMSSRRINDPLTGAQFTNNVIPTNRLSPQALFFAKFIPDPNTPSGTFSFAPSRQLDTDQFTARLDQSITENHRLFIRWSFHDNRLNEPHAFPALGYAPLKTRGQNIVASVTNILTQNLTHEFRFSYLPAIVDLEAYGQGTDFNKEAGIRGFEETARPGVVGSFPDFGWSGYAAMNGSAFDQRPKTQDLKVYEWTDNLTWVKGWNIYKFGTKVRRWVPLFTDSKQYQGQWTFNGSISGEAFADFMLGYPRQVTRAFPADTFGGEGNYYHFYFQDDIKVNSRLTLNLGLRYEYSPWLKGYRGQLGAFDPTLARPVIIGSRGDQIDLNAQFAGPSSFALFKDFIQTSSQAGLPLSITSPDKNQWAPRIGFAWRPFGEKTVLRGGYGIFYETENTDGRVNNNMIPFKLDETGFNDQTPAVRTMADFFLGRTLTTTAAPSLGPTYTKLRMGYDQHWNFGVQHELFSGTVLEVDYVANKGSFLNGVNAANNPPAGAGAIQSRRPYPRFGTINYFSQDVSTNYHALQAKLEKRLSTGLWYLVSYTFSKSMLHQNAPATGGNTAWERSLSDFDIPHNLAVSWGYELPVGRGKRLLSGANGFTDALLGGWQIQGIVGVRSGRPFTPTISADRANIGIGGQRPNRLGSGNLDNPTVERWFDTSAFVLPAQFAYGNSGANILREDRFKSFDFSIFKQFRITEGSRLQFRAEAFNVTNTPSFNAPNTAIDTAAGGRVTSTAS